MIRKSNFVLMVILVFSSGLTCLAQDVGKSDYQVRRVFRELIEPVTKSVVEIQNERESTLVFGTVVSSDGYIVTKASVIGDRPVYCKIANDQRYKATLIAQDEDVDLALLKIEANDLAAVDLGSVTAPRTGSFVVSASRLTQPLGFGVVGVDERRFRQRRSPYSNRSYLGVECEPVEGGLKVVRVMADSGARKAGLKRGDKVLTVGGESVSSVRNLRDELKKFQPKQPVEIQIERDGESKSVSAKLGIYPEDRAEDHWGGGPFSKRRFGFPSVIVHDTTLTPQQCGGPLVDTNGKVVGINIARALRVATYAIPSDDVLAFVKASKTTQTNKN